MVVRRSAVAAARQINLNQKKLKREAEQIAKLDLWCVEHDGDGNGEFDREELRGLLNALHPTQPVEDSMLDELLEKATGVYTSSLTLRGDKRNRMLKVPSWWCHRPPRAVSVGSRPALHTQTKPPYYLHFLQFQPAGTAESPKRRCSRRSSNTTAVSRRSCPHRMHASSALCFHTTSSQ